MFEHTNNDALLEHLKSGELDLVLTTNHKGFESMEHTFVSHEHLILAVPADWDICKYLKIKLSLLKKSLITYIEMQRIKVSISKTLNSCHIFHYVQTVICIQEVKRFFIIMMQKQIMPCM